jgi:predicted MFS family arabinose efflux permease
MTTAPTLARRTKLDVPLLVAGSAAFSISTLFSSMKPVLIARFIEQADYSPGLAGLAAAMPFIGGACSSLLLPWALRRFSAGAAITGFGLGLTIAEAGNAVWFASAPLLLLGQFVAGLCGGFLMGMVSQLIATSARSEESFGIVDTAGVLMMSLMIASVGAAVEGSGLRGGFLAAAALCLAFAMAMILCRNALPAAPRHDNDEQRVPLRIGWRGFVVIAAGVVFVTFSGLGFAFMVTAARTLGFGYEDASYAIGIILFLSATGCLAGGWCAARFGPRSSLLTACALCALGWHVALTTGSKMVFLFALAPAIFALQFCFPILLALTGPLDAEGRLAAIAAPLIVSGFAWAAILAGIIVERWGLAALPSATGIGMILCAGLVLAGTKEPRAP